MEDFKKYTLAGLLEYLFMIWLERQLPAKQAGPKFKIFHQGYVWKNNSSDFKKIWLLICAISNVYAAFAETLCNFDLLL